MAIQKLLIIYLMFSIKINDAKYCVDEFLIAEHEYDNCMGEIDLKVLQNKKHFRPTDLCWLLKLADKCLTRADEIVANCSNFEESHLDNFGRGIRAFNELECGSEKITLESTRRRISACENKQRDQLDKCDENSKYRLTRFLPIPVITLHFDNFLWTDSDCRRRYNWARCWANVLDKCEDKFARDRYIHTFSTIIKSYPHCSRILKKKMESDGFRVVNQCSLPFLNNAILPLILVSHFFKKF